MTKSNKVLQEEKTEIVGSTKKKITDTFRKLTEIHLRKFVCIFVKNKIYSVGIDVSYLRSSKHTENQSSNLS